MEFIFTILAVDVVNYYEIIRNPNDHMLPECLKKKKNDHRKKAERLCAIYHCHKIRIRAEISRHMALQFLTKVLFDMKQNIIPKENSFQLILRRLFVDLNLFYPTKDFRKEHASIILDKEVNDLIVAVENFIELSNLIQVGDIAFKLAWSVFEYSLDTGKVVFSHL